MLSRLIADVHTVFSSSKYWLLRVEYHLPIVVDCSNITGCASDSSAISRFRFLLSQGVIMLPQAIAMPIVR